MVSKDLLVQLLSVSLKILFLLHCLYFILKADKRTIY